MRISVPSAIAQLKGGRVVALPTETVYGLAASLSQPKAIEEIFKLKGRPLGNPLIIHVSSLSDIEYYARKIPPRFNELALAFWPGPLTLIVPIQPDLVPPLVRAHLPTAGFRMPRHPMTLEVIEASGPLVMPSANLSGKPSATSYEHVETDFGKNFPVLDGGSCSQGLESTILYYEESRWMIGRLGAIAAEEFESILGYVPALFKAEKPICPGQFFRHYAPKAKLFLGDRSKLNEVSFVLGFTERHYPPDKKVLFMGSIFKAEEVAEHLYQVLRQLDVEGASEAWVDMDFPREGLWMTVEERLVKAGE
ncbi:MAG: threonylcarbamoyl-AMP synthase [Candidatus Protochlamydia sp.]|nr:threonylcarbamoyl-AMP synthase [Candidatus Protochlamydia sp.]